MVWSNYIYPQTHILYLYFIAITPYSLVQLGPGYFLKLNFLFDAIRTFLIINIATAVTPTAVALSLIALLSVIRTAGFALK